MPHAGLLLSRDLFFASKVTGTAGALGLTVRSGSSLETLREAVTAGELKLVILDLDCPGISPSEVIEALPIGSEIVTVAFGPHIHEEQLAAARHAGFQHTLPRSKFSAGLAEFLRTTLRSA